jgi:hypothetical protein
MSEPNLSDAPKSNGSAFFGWLLMAIGGLMVTLCGLCSLAFGIAALSSPNVPAETFSGRSILPLVVVFGAPPIVVGAFLFWVGYRLVRPRRKPMDPGAFD